MELLILAGSMRLTVVSGVAAVEYSPFTVVTSGLATTAVVAE